MESLAGRLLVATPDLLDPNFFRTVVLVLQHDEDGALGLVLNRPSADSIVLHLPDWAAVACQPDVVFVGGPVEPAVGIALALEGEGAPTPLSGVTMADLSEPPGSTDSVRLFAGYAGWGADQLELELEEGAWVVVDAHPVDAFSTEPDTLWSEVLRRQRGPLAMMATFPVDPSLN